LRDESEIGDLDAEINLRSETEKAKNELIE
jgi:hypothetical protein